VRFWDSSAIVPLLLNEGARVRMLSYHDEDPSMFVWWATPVEVVSAVARRERDGQLTLSEASAALQRLDVLASGWYELQPSPRLRLTARRLLRVHPLRAADALQPSPRLRLTARRLLRVHPLRAADALQLAAAVLAVDREATSLEFVCLDEQLGEAARREGFPVLD
jgi:predicted nucleic acid-binding protein